MPESSAADVAVARRVPAEHLHGAVLTSFHAAAYVHLKLNKCCGFLELQIDYVIDANSETLFVLSCAIDTIMYLDGGYYEKHSRDGDADGLTGGAFRKR